MYQLKKRRDPAPEESLRESIIGINPPRAFLFAFAKFYTISITRTPPPSNTEDGCKGRIRAPNLGRNSPPETLQRVAITIAYIDIAQRGFTDSIAVLRFHRMK